MERLNSYFIQSGFDEATSLEISGYFEKKTLDKGDHFVEAGKVASKLAFLASGQCQYYSISSEGDERTTYISLPNTFVASLFSFLNEVPAQESIRALTAVTLYEIPKKHVLLLMEEIRGFQTFYTKILEFQICCIDKNRLDFITLTAEQRYEKLLREEPELFQQVPLQYIASMLGMTPRHLSRLRAKS